MSKSQTDLDEFLNETRPEMLWIVNKHLINELRRDSLTDEGIERINKLGALRVNLYMEYMENKAIEKVHAMHDNLQNAYVYDPKGGRA